jgi:putative oxidoreductase
MKDLGLFALRLVFGGLIALHGYPKLFGGSGKKVSADAERYLGPGFNNFMENGGIDKHIGLTKQLGMPAPEVLGALSAGTEFFGGLALIFGWKTRLAALLLLGNMAVAIQKVHAKNGLMNQGGYEMPLLYAAGFATALLAGSGKIGLDKS